jgi:hypothetical protein
MNRFLFGDFESTAAKAAVFSRRLVVIAFLGLVTGVFTIFALPIVVCNLVFGGMSFHEGKSTNNEALRKSGMRSMVWAAIIGAVYFSAIAIARAIGLIR